MTFVQSAISFGGYTFPVGMRLSVRQNDQRIEDTAIPFQMGVNAPPGVPDKGIIDLTGTIGGSGAVDSNGDYITTRDECEAEVQLMLSYLRNGYQQLRKGDGDNRYCMAQLSKFKTTYLEAEGRCIAHLDIEFMVEDPRWLSNTTHSQSFGTGGSMTISNAGNTLSYPYIVTYGPFTNPYIKVQPTGLSGYIQDTATVAMVYGDVIQFKCDPRDRANGIIFNNDARLDLLGTSGIVNTVGDSAFFPYLLPGNNTVTLGAASGSGTGSHILMYWQDAWYL